MPHADNPAIVCWNPVKRRFRGRIGRRLPFYAPPNNFGDILGPVIVARILENHGVSAPPAQSFEQADGQRKLLSIGSVLHFAYDGDLVWGTGRNGKIPDSKISFTELDVRMVRGPLTRAFLMERGIDVPEVYGDPGLLVPHLFADRIAGWKKGSTGPIFVANLNDPKPKQRAGRLIDPCAPLWDVLRAIYESDLVLSTSLHGFILAEAFGVRARLLRSDAESPFKYADYFAGTGGRDLVSYSSVEEALSAPDHPAPEFDPVRMVEAFPIGAFTA